MMKMTETVKQLLIINVIFYVGSQFVATAYPLFSLYYPENPNFRFWQPLTSMFMHAAYPNLMHIFFNMFALYSFGSALEHYWGSKKFLFFYISCGLGAALLHIVFNYYQIHSNLIQASDLQLSDDILNKILNFDIIENNYYSREILFEKLKPIIENSGKANLLNGVNFNALYQANVENNTPAVGASGAIYGLLVAFAFMFPSAQLGLMFIPVPIRAKYFAPGILVVDLVLGFKGSSLFGSGGTGIAHFAHLGGAITGFIMMWYWKKTSFNKNRWD